MEDILILFKASILSRATIKSKKYFRVFYAKLPFTVIPNIYASQYNFLNPSLGNFQCLFNDIFQRIAS